MKFEKDSNFDNYVEKYKNLPLNEKKELVVKQMEELQIALYTLNKKYENESKILYNHEILDLKKEDATEADFVEAMFIYSNSIKELLASFVNALEK